MPASQHRVEGTREAIVSILRRRSQVSVDEFATDLGLAGATVRRHLDVLLRDGLVEVEQVRGGAGRPKHVFSLTEHGADLFPHHYVRLTRRLVDEMLALDEADTAGRDGGALASVVFTRMTDRLVERYAGRVAGQDLKARAHAAVALLADEGLDFEVAEAGDGAVLLLGRGCPCRRLQSGGGYGCQHDCSLFARLLDARVTSVPAEALPSPYVGGYRVAT